MAYGRQRDARVAMCIIPCINVCTSARGCVEERVGCGSVKPARACMRAYVCPVCVCVCTRHLRRGVNDGGGTTTRDAGRNCEIVADDHLDPLGIYTRTRQNCRTRRCRTRTDVRAEDREDRRFLSLSLSHIARFNLITLHQVVQIPKNFDITEVTKRVNLRKLLSVRVEVIEI